MSHRVVFQPCLLQNHWTEIYWHLLLVFVATETAGKSLDIWFKENSLVLLQTLLQIVLMYH